MITLRAILVTEKQKYRIKELENQLGLLKKHTAEMCKKGKHLLHSWATGLGGSGHCITECRVCDYNEHGYD